MKKIEQKIRKLVTTNSHEFTEQLLWLDYAESTDKFGKLLRTQSFESVSPKETFSFNFNYKWKGICLKLIRMRLK